MIKYSPRAARAIARLKRPYNEVDIFVEDTTSRNMWMELLKSIIPPTIRLKSITPLGGRDRVIDACKLDQASDGRRKLYIIDGDFDYLVDRPKPRLKHLYRLRAYCVENIIISEEAVKQVGIACQPNRSESEILQTFDFSGWFASIRRPLVNLFVAYAATRFLDEEF